MESKWKNFVFIDDNSRPFAVMMLSGQPWLCCWNDGNKCFVTLRTVTQNEIFVFAEKKLPENQANIYFNCAERKKKEETMPPEKHEGWEEEQAEIATQERTDNESDKIKTFTIEATMKGRWISHFMSMLACMENYGQAGRSREVGIYADGDGDFRPKFESNVEWTMQEPVKDEHGNRMYDAG